MTQFVRVEINEAIATIRIDRPPMNALNLQVINELARAAGQAEENPAIRAVVLYGGERMFASGADVRELANADCVSVAADSLRIQRAFTAVARIPKPVVAAITGLALGGGLELALCADFRVAGKSVRVGQPEIKLGIIPGAGATQRLPRLIGTARAKDLIFTGRLVSAAEAHKIGLVDRVVPDDAVFQEALDMVAGYAMAPALALRSAKQAIDHGLETDLDTGLEIERLQFAALFATGHRRTRTRTFIETEPGLPRLPESDTDRGGGTESS
jgi:enoyl-CoA hydratase/carnithine racemase